MNKICIFNDKKQCDDCNECNICDLDRTKICNDCGKCLELEGHDLKEVKIDEVIEDGEELEDINQEINLPGETTDFLEEESDQENWDLIDDIEGLPELIDELREGGKPELKGYSMEYPGLIIKK